MKIPVLYNSNQWAVLVATGPSLTEAVVDCIYEYRSQLVLFGCNDAYRMFPCLNVHYACDPQWWDKHYKNCRLLPAQKWTQDEDIAKKYNLNYVEGKFDDGFSTNSQFINLGSNSGYQQLGLAYLMGIRKAILIGYNMQLGPRGERHFFGNHPAGLRNTENYAAFVQAYRHAVKPSLGLTVVNCTEDSKLDMFPQRDLLETLKHVRAGTPPI